MRDLLLITFGVALFAAVYALATRPLMHRAEAVAAAWADRC